MRKGILLIFWLKEFNCFATQRVFQWFCLNWATTTKSTIKQKNGAFHMVFRSPKVSSFCLSVTYQYLLHVESQSCLLGNPMSSNIQGAPQKSPNFQKYNYFKIMPVMIIFRSEIWFKENFVKAKFGFFVWGAPYSLCENES